MRELFDTTLNETDTPFSKKQLIEAVQNAEVLVPTVTDKIDEEVILKNSYRDIADFINLIYPDSRTSHNTVGQRLKENKYFMYYVSGIEWVNKDLPRYNIQVCFSSDGIIWDREIKRIAIDLLPGEDALARPYVYYDEEFKIFRINQDDPEYKESKISYAGRLDPMAHGLVILLIDDGCKTQDDIILETI